MKKKNTRDLILEQTLTGAVDKTLQQFEKDNFDYYSEENRN